MIDESAGPSCFEAEHGLFAGVHKGQRAAAQGSCGRVEIDVVLHQVFGRVIEGQFDIIALMHHHQRAGDRAVKGHRLKVGAVVNLNLFFHDLQFELDHARLCRRSLFVFVNHRRADKLVFDPL